MALQVIQPVVLHPRVMMIDAATVMMIDAATVRMIVALVIDAATVHALTDNSHSHLTLPYRWCVETALSPECR